MELTVPANATHFSHSCKVSEISGILASHTEFDDEEVAQIKAAALFHDVGKCSISPSILNKPGKLTAHEFSIIKTHTAVGYHQITQRAGALHLEAMVALFHHERLDGRGYYGLKGDEIPRPVRLISVVDVFEALISRRSYKPCWSTSSALNYLRENARTQFDPVYVSALIDHTDEIMGLYA